MLYADSNAAQTVITSPAVSGFPLGRQRWHFIFRNQFTAVLSQIRTYILNELFLLAVRLAVCSRSQQEYCML
jgi:hypothetical protein